MPFYNVKDNLAKLPLGASYAHGAGSITLVDASGLPASPLLLTLVKSAGYGTDTEVSRVFAVSAIVGNVLTATIASGYVDDTDFTTSDFAELRVDAQSISDLNSAVAAIQASTSGTNTGDQVVPANTTATTHQFLTGYNATTGVFTKAQPAAADISGLATSATTDTTTAANIADSTNRRFVTDAQLVILGNTSGTNTGDQTNITGNAGTVTTISGLITAGSGVTITGAGTSASPYSITATTGGTGTVTSVGLTMPAGFTVSSSPVTTSGAIAVTTTLSGVLKGTGTGIVAATAGTDYVTPSGSITGNAATATKLATARAINGTNFDGSAAITITAAAGTLTGSALAAGVTSSSLTTVGTLANLTVTNPIVGSVTGSSATVATISGLIAAGTNITITGSGTSGSPYSIAASGGGGSPGGSSGQIQYNNAGAFGGTANLVIGSNSCPNYGAFTNSSPADGDHWNDATQHCPAIYRDGLVQFQRRLIYAQYGAVSATAGGGADTTLLDGTHAIGTLSLPAGFLNRLGRRLTINMTGWMTSSSDMTAPAVIFMFYLGGTRIASSDPLRPVQSLAASPYSVIVDIMTVATGVSGAVDSGGAVLCAQAGGTNQAVSFTGTLPIGSTGSSSGTIVPQTPRTVDLTAALALDIRVNMSWSGTSIVTAATHVSVEVSG